MVLTSGTSGDAGQESTKLRAFALFLGVSFGSFVILLTPGVEQKDGPLLAVFPPWMGKRDVLATALSAPVAIVDMSQFKWTVAVVPLAEHARDDLRKPGAIAFLSARGSALCAAPPGVD